MLLINIDTYWKLILHLQIIWLVPPRGDCFAPANQYCVTADLKGITIEIVL